MRGTAVEASTKSVTFSYGPRFMDVPVLEDQEHTHNSTVWTRDLVRRYCQERWMIGTISERMPGKSVLAALLDYDAINSITTVLQE